MNQLSEQPIVIVNGSPLDEAFSAPAEYEIERVEGQLLSAQRIGGIPTVAIPLRNLFSDGVYIREVFMPAGSFVIGHEHKTRHFNIVLQGVASVIMGGKACILKAPFTFVSEPGVRKVLYIHEDMIFQTVHANPLNLLKIDELEHFHVRKSESFELHLQEMKALKTALQEGQL